MGAHEDTDGDGISNIDEYRLNTSLTSRDSDGDGIEDGEEIVAGADGFITRPDLADTDGDGLNDRLEIEAGSDPTDANDANYAGLITALRVQPSSAVLFYNTIDSDSSLQIRV